MTARLVLSESLHFPRRDRPQYSRVHAIQLLMSETSQGLRRGRRGLVQTALHYLALFKFLTSFFKSSYVFFARAFLLPIAFVLVRLHIKTMSSEKLFLDFQ